LAKHRVAMYETAIAHLDNTIHSIRMEVFRRYIMQLLYNLKQCDTLLIRLFSICHVPLGIFDIVERYRGCIFHQISCQTDL